MVQCWELGREDGSGERRGGKNRRERKRRENLQCDTISFIFFIFFRNVIQPTSAKRYQQEKEDNNKRKGLFTMTLEGSLIGEVI